MARLEQPDVCAGGCGKTNRECYVHGIPTTRLHYDVAWICRRCEEKAMLWAARRVNQEERATPAP